MGSPCAIVVVRVLVFSRAPATADCLHCLRLRLRRRASWRVSFAVTHGWLSTRLLRLCLLLLMLRGALGDVCQDGEAGRLQVVAAAA